MKTIALTCLVAVIAVGHLSQCASVSKTASSKSSDEVRSDLIKQLTQLLDVRRSESSKKTIDSAKAPKEAHKTRLESLRTPIQVGSKRTDSCDDGFYAEMDDMGYVIYPYNLNFDFDNYDGNDVNSDAGDDNKSADNARDIDDSYYDDDESDSDDDDDDDGSDFKLANIFKVIRQHAEKSEAKKKVIRAKRSVGQARSKTRTAQRDDGMCRLVIRGSDPKYSKLYGVVAVLNDDGSKDCSNGHLKLYNGDDESGDPFMELCGRTTPQLYESSGKDIYVDFSNGGGDDRAGFYIFWLGEE